MNKEMFLQFIENDRNCEQEHLDIAVKKGLIKAKNNRFAPKKVLMLAAACLFTFIMCFTINLKPFKTVTEIYYQNWHKNMPDSSQILNDYLADIIINVNKYLGGE